MNICFKMGTSRAQQFEAIGLGAGVGQFVAETTPAE